MTTSVDRLGSVRLGCVRLCYRVEMGLTYRKDPVAYYVGITILYKIISIV